MGKHKGKKKISTAAGCGYRISVSSGSARIFPTTNQGVCYLEFGIGDATFKIDPKNPPDSIKRVLTRDAEGSYAPQVELGVPRATRSFSSVEMVEESHTDADGNTETFTLPKLNDLDIKVAVGTYVATGLTRISKGTKVMT